MEFRLTTSFLRVKWVGFFYFFFILLFLISAFLFYPDMKAVPGTFAGLAVGTLLASMFMKESNPKITGVIKFDEDGIQVSSRNENLKISKSEIKKINTILTGYKGYVPFKLFRPGEPRNGFSNQINITTDSKTHRFFVFISSKTEFEKLKDIKTWYPI